MLWLELEMDETLWAGGGKMGYKLHPCLMDGAFQANAVQLCQKLPDYSGIPQSCSRLHSLKPTTSSNRVVI
jgi:hypothetical protein